MLGFSPYLLLGGVAALLVTNTATYFYADSHGADRVLYRVQTADQLAFKVAGELAASRQQVVDLTAQSEAQHDALLTSVAAKGRDTTKEFYHENPVADKPCLDLSRVSSVSAADAAADAADSSGAGTDQVQNTPAVGKGNVKQ